MMPTPGNASAYLEKMDQAADIVEDVSINLRDLLAQLRNLKLVKQDAYDAVYLLRRDLGRAVAILDGGYPTPRTSIFHREGNEESPS